MAKDVTIGEAMANFLKLIRRVEAGEEIVVPRGRDPVARDHAAREDPRSAWLRLVEGEIEIGEDFDSPLAD